MANLLFRDSTKYLKTYFGILRGIDKMVKHIIIRLRASVSCIERFIAVLFIQKYAVSSPISPTLAKQPYMLYSVRVPN